MKISKKERDLIDFLIKQPVSKEDKELIDPYKKYAFDFATTIYSHKLINEKKFDECEETIDSLGDKFLLIEIKKDHGILRSIEPILKYSRHGRIDLSLNLEEDLSQVGYIMHFLIGIENSKQKIYSKEDKTKWLNDLF